jgi:hypothetical protein
VLLVIVMLAVVAILAPFIYSLWLLMQPGHLGAF